MENNSNSIFIRALLVDKVKLKPEQITKQYANNILSRLQEQYEGKCTYHGFIKPKSIKINRISVGLLVDVSLNGDVIYNVAYHADVCNPAVGSSITAKVVNTNMFGILAENGINVNNVYYPILDVIIAKNNVTNTNIDLNTIEIGSTIIVEVVGKKFELNDKKITVVGRITENKTLNRKHDIDVNDPTEFEEENNSDVGTSDSETEKSEKSVDADEEEEDNDTEEEIDDDDLDDDSDGAGSDGDDSISSIE